MKIYKNRNFNRFELNFNSKSIIEGNSILRKNIGFEIFIVDIVC